MLSPKTLIRFSILAIVLFIGLIVLFRTTTLDEGFGNLLRISTNPVLSGKLDNQGMARLRKTNVSRGTVHADIEILFLKYDKANPEGVPVNGTMIDSWVYACMPFLFFLSLTIATPLQWKKRLYALLAGTILFYIFLLTKIWMNIRWEGYKIGFADSGLIKKTEVLHELLTNHTSFSLFVALFIWAVVVFPYKRFREFPHKLFS